MVCCGFLCQFLKNAGFFSQKMPVFLVFYLLKNVKFYFLFCCVSIVYTFMIIFYVNFFWYIQNLVYICSVFEKDTELLKKLNC